MHILLSVNTGFGEDIRPRKYNVFRDEIFGHMRSVWQGNRQTIPQGTINPPVREKYYTSKNKEMNTPENILSGQIEKHKTPGLQYYYFKQDSR